MKTAYILAAILLIVPTSVLLDVPLYNHVNPELYGLPFFWWFQGMWLVIATVMYAIAALILQHVDPDKEEFQ